MELFHFTDSGEKILKEGFHCPLTRDYLIKLKSHISLMIGLSLVTRTPYEHGNDDDAVKVIDSFMNRFSGGTIIWVTKNPQYEHDLVADCLIVKLPKGAIEIMSNGNEFAYLIEMPMIAPRYFQMNPAWKSIT